MMKAFLIFHNLYLYELLKDYLPKWSRTTKPKWACTVLYLQSSKNCIFYFLMDEILLYTGIWLTKVIQIFIWQVFFFFLNSKTLFTFKKNYIKCHYFLFGEMCIGHASLVKMSWSDILCCNIMSHINSVF